MVRASLCMGRCRGRRVCLGMKGSNTHPIPAHFKLHGLAIHLEKCVEGSGFQAVLQSPRVQKKCLWVCEVGEASMGGGGEHETWGIRLCFYIWRFHFLKKNSIYCLKVLRRHWPGAFQTVVLKLSSVLRNFTSLLHFPTPTRLSSCSHTHT